MKRTKKSVKHEVEKTEIVCEMNQTEFDKVCAETAASLVVKLMGSDPTVDDVAAGVAMTSLLAKFVSKLDEKLFNEPTTDDKKEEN